MDGKIKICVMVSLLGLTVAGSLRAWQEASSSKITLAVMDFKNNSSAFGYDRLLQIIPEMLKTELSRSAEIEVLERSKIESILAEQALVQAGVIENQAAQEIGKLAGAEYIIHGEITNPSYWLRIDVHVIRVATGQIVGEKVTGKDERNLEPMIRLLAQNLIFDLTGKGQHQSATQVHRYRWEWGLGTTAAMALATTVLHMQYRTNFDRYHQADRLNEFDRYYGRANNYYQARNVMLWATGTIAWTTVILWIKSRDENNQIYASRIDGMPHDSALDLHLAIGWQEGNYRLGIGFRF
ncbi:MAG: CsgG/HfaB family protein [candidate division KSB1 bacterium]|nr:CsgG/HfaB family protein [candidate division KSB1 bacterium]MDZ7319036.1 CsgG/HfaB family protein [candidate division KSB1 bacterium]MDZ7341453.1 CsgG/HfaB family protein [candidate division KSB1 bacterium]